MSSPEGKTACCFIVGGEPAHYQISRCVLVLISEEDAKRPLDSLTLLITPNLTFKCLVEYFRLTHSKFT